MQAWKIIVPLILISIGFAYLTVDKIFKHTASIKVLNFPEQNICYLVTPRYKVKLTENGFNYFGGKNIGEVTFIEGKIAPSYNARKIGEFEAGYKKVTNYRLAQYQLGPDLILFEKFQFVKKEPPNLQPLKEGCDKLLKMHGALEL